MKNQNYYNLYIKRNIDEARRMTDANTLALEIYKVGTGDRRSRSSVERLIETLKNGGHWLEIAKRASRIIDMFGFMGSHMFFSMDIARREICDTLRSDFKPSDKRSNETWLYVKSELHAKGLDAFLAKVMKEYPCIRWMEFSMNISLSRAVYTENISWGTLSSETINWIRLLYTNDTFHKILEVGAGRGFNAMMLKKACIPIVATDEKAYEQTFTTVEVSDGVNAIQKYSDCDCLLMVWPPYAEPFAFNCLTAFKGRHLFYVGEYDGGCTGDDAFFSELSRNWNYECTKNVPQFADIHDCFFYYTKK